MIILLRFSSLNSKKSKNTYRTSAHNKPSPIFRKPPLFFRNSAAKPVYLINDPKVKKNPARSGPVLSTPPKSRKYYQGILDNPAAYE